MARTAMIMCQSRPLEPRADCPRHWGGLSAVQNFEPTDLQTSLTKSGSDRRTVRSPGADRPQFKRLAHTETAVFLSQNFQYEADCPPPRTGRSAVHFGHPRQNYQVSAPVSAFKGGPSAPMDRTVRSSFWTTNRAKNGSVRAHPR